jgi:hypothetical protein
VDAESSAASCACASSVVSSPSACSDTTAVAQQVSRVDGADARPTCDASQAGTVVADTADGMFYGCCGKTTQWLALGGAGSAVLSPPVAAPVAAVELPFSDDLSPALTLLDPAPLSIFQRASDLVDVDLSAVGCVITVDAVAGVVQSAPGQSGVHLQGLMSDVNVAMQRVRAGCVCIGASGETSILATVTSAGVTATTSIPVAVGTPAQVTTISGVVVDHSTAAPIEGAQVRLSYIGRLGSADDCTVDTVTTDVAGLYSIECPSEYLGGGGHHLRLYASESGAGEYSVRVGFAATVGGTALGPKLSLVPSVTSTGAVSGLCLSAATLEPLGGASVSLQRVSDDTDSATPTQTQLSDAQGAFGFADVAQGAYWLTVQRPFAVMFEDVVVVSAGVTESLLAPLAQERALAAHWRAVLLWRGSGELNARVEATGCAGGSAVVVTAEAPSGCGAEHTIRHEASYSSDAGSGGGAASMLVEKATALGTYMFSVSSSSWSDVHGATVRIYSSSTLVSEMVLPHVHPGDGDAWNVFCWDAATSGMHNIGSVGSGVTCADGCDCA